MLRHVSPCFRFAPVTHLSFSSLPDLRIGPICPPICASLQGGQGDTFYQWDLDRSSFTHLQIYLYRIFLHMVGFSSLQFFARHGEHVRYNRLLKVRDGGHRRCGRGVAWRGVGAHGKAWRPLDPGAVCGHVMRARGRAAHKSVSFRPADSAHAPR